MFVFVLVYSTRVSFLQTRKIFDKFRNLICSLNGIIKVYGWFLVDIALDEINKSSVVKVGCSFAVRMVRTKFMTFSFRAQSVGNMDLRQINTFSHDSMRCEPKLADYLTASLPYLQIQTHVLKCIAYMANAESQ